MILVILRHILEFILGIPISFKASSLVKGYWSSGSQGLVIWHRLQVASRGRDLRPGGSEACCISKGVVRDLGTLGVETRNLSKSPRNEGMLPVSRSGLRGVGLWHTPALRTAAGNSGVAAAQGMERREGFCRTCPGNMR